MMSTETWPQPALRLWILAQRFQKFLAVGAVGLLVNQGMLFVFRDVVSFRLLVASPIAIAISMFVTFILNEFWTWHDRGSGPVVHRAMHYVPINSVGLLINWLVLLLIVEELDVHYFWANLVGAGVAAVWNFSLNHLITWRD